MALHQPSNCSNTLPRSAEQLLPSLIDQTAKSHPQRLYAEIPASPTTCDEGWRKITYSDFANAIYGVSWLLNETLGQGMNHDTIAYIGPNDLTYVIMILGASRAGYKVRIQSLPILNELRVQQAAHFVCE